MIGPMRSLQNFDPKWAAHEALQLMTLAFNPVDLYRQFGSRPWESSGYTNSRTPITHKEREARQTRRKIAKQSKLRNR